MARLTLAAVHAAASRERVCVEHGTAMTVRLGSYWIGVDCSKHRTALHAAVCLHGNGFFDGRGAPARCDRWSLLLGYTR